MNLNLKIKTYFIIPINLLSNFKPILFIANLYQRLKNFDFMRYYHLTYVLIRQLLQYSQNRL